MKEVKLLKFLINQNIGISIKLKELGYISKKIFKKVDNSKSYNQLILLQYFSSEDNLNLKLICHLYFLYSKFTNFLNFNQFNKFLLLNNNKLWLDQTNISNKVYYYSENQLGNFVTVDKLLYNFYSYNIIYENLYNSWSSEFLDCDNDLIKNYIFEQLVFSFDYFIYNFDNLDEYEIVTNWDLKYFDSIYNIRFKNQYNLVSKCLNPNLLINFKNKLLNINSVIAINFNFLKFKIHKKYQKTKFIHFDNYINKIIFLSMKNQNKLLKLRVKNYKKNILPKKLIKYYSRNIVFPFIKYKKILFNKMISIKKKRELLLYSIRNKVNLSIYNYLKFIFKNYYINCSWRVVKLLDNIKNYAYYKKIPKQLLLNKHYFYLTTNLLVVKQKIIPKYKFVDLIVYNENFRVSNIETNEFSDYIWTSVEQYSQIKDVDKNLFIFKKKILFKIYDKTKNNKNLFKDYSLVLKENYYLKEIKKYKCISKSNIYYFCNKFNKRRFIYFKVLLSNISNRNVIIFKPFRLFYNTTLLWSKIFWFTNNNDWVKSLSYKRLYLNKFDKFILIKINNQNDNIINDNRLIRFYRYNYILSTFISHKLIRQNLRDNKKYIKIKKKLFVNKNIKFYLKAFDANFPKWKLIKSWYLRNKFFLSDYVYKFIPFKLFSIIRQFYNIDFLFIKFINSFKIKNNYNLSKLFHVIKFNFLSFFFKRNGANYSFRKNLIFYKKFVLRNLSSKYYLNLLYPSFLENLINISYLSKNSFYLSSLFIFNTYYLRLVAYNSIILKLINFNIYIRLVFYFIILLKKLNMIIQKYWLSKITKNQKIINYTLNKNERLYHSWHLFRAHFCSSYDYILYNLFIF